MAQAVTLDFLARQQERMLEEMGRQRDDMTVLLATVQRLDGTMQGLVNEIRALHGQHAGASRRLDGLGGKRKARSLEPPATCPIVRVMSEPSDNLVLILLRRMRGKGEEKVSRKRCHKEKRKRCQEPFRKGEGVSREKVSGKRCQEPFRCGCVGPWPGQDVAWILGSRPRMTID